MDRVHVALLEIDGALKYFMFEGYKDEEFQQKKESPYLTTYRDNLKFIEQSLGSIASSNLISPDSVKAIRLWVQALDDDFHDLQKTFLLRGFKDFGMEGNLRAAIHAVENSSADFDKVEMLMLRRHEKDFFLRKDLKYKQDFNKRIDAFLTVVAVDGNPLGTEVGRHLSIYKSLFNEVVDLETKIGLVDTKGLRGRLNRQLSQLNASMMTMRNEINEKASRFSARSEILLVVIFAFQLIIGISLALLYSDLITKPVKELQRAMQSLADGIFPGALTVKTGEEIGKAKSAFNQLMDRMKAATRFAEALGRGELKTTYDPAFSGDILAKSMIRMQQQLTHALDEQQVINWTNQGSALLSDILKNENEEAALLGDKLMKLIVEYLKMNQGALYLLQGDDKTGRLERMSTYAYSKKKFISQTVELGQGLVGQCFLEQHEIILKEVPASYVKITSGLGESVPRFVALIPLVIRNRSVGVMEFASFHALEQFQIEFLKKIAETIAAIFVNRQTNATTARLLAAAREREQRLVQSEEELRQNSEELQAIGEQMRREQRALEEKILLLERKLLTRRHALEEVT